MDINSLPAVMVPLTILVIPFFFIILMFKFIEREYRNYKR